MCARMAFQRDFDEAVNMQVVGARRDRYQCIPELTSSGVAFTESAAFSYVACSSRYESI